MAFIEPCFGIGHNLSLICQMTSEDIKHQLIIIITVAYALSGVVVSEASRFVALCRRPCRIGIADRDKLMVSYILPIFS